LVRNLTPPYITAEPQIIHRRLDESSSGLATSTSSDTSKFSESSTRKAKTSLAKDFFWSPRLSPEQPTVNPLPRFLILASDGFSDLCSDSDAPFGSNERMKHIISSWAYSMSLLHPPRCVSDALPWSKGDNMALRLLRRALGEDRFSVSKVLTLDMDEAWIDDTTLVVMTI